MRFEEFLSETIPDYAVLSHTWESQEISYKDYVALEAHHSYTGSDMNKITGTCAQAEKDGIRYVWVDNCCINKESSAELTEAINSMFKWYANARRCYVYLSDFMMDVNVEHEDEFPKIALVELAKCRWFERGWTLQELLAPLHIQFYNRAWGCIGSRDSLASTISSITRIPYMVLQNRLFISLCSVAQKMSWAATRRTTRGEDMAYCLFGLFDVNLPLLYGEGAVKAFIRLQEAIMRESNDLTLFAWQAEHSHGRGIFARSPREFLKARDITSALSLSKNPEFTMTNKGLRITTKVQRLEGRSVILPLNCNRDAAGMESESESDFENETKALTLGIYLVMHNGTFLRDRPHELVWIRMQDEELWDLQAMYIAKHEQLMSQLPLPQLSVRSTKGLKKRGTVRGAGSRDVETTKALLERSETIRQSRSDMTCNRDTES